MNLKLYRVVEKNQYNGKVYEKGEIVELPDDPKPSHHFVEVDKAEAARIDRTKLVEPNKGLLKDEKFKVEPPKLVEPKKPAMDVPPAKKTVEFKKEVDE